MTEFASCSISEGIATITLDDGKANAFSFDMMAAINQAMDEAEAGADVIIITGRDGVMCAGFDLKVMQNDADKVPEMVGNGGKLLVRIFSSKKPVIIASTGHGIAAGGLLMLAADYRIGVDAESRYGLNESAIGMVLPPFGYDLAAFKINNKYLDRCFAGAELIDPQTAIEASFLDEVVASDDLMNRALEKAAEMQKLDGKAFAGNKKLVRGALTAKMTADLESGKGLQVGG
ncbi:MAG: Carnitinyl-CoA dehydratase [Alphaproteobacteria bacterium]|nr:MAG: Carnitinyl-CoA dehydratase [Alphaproteobacteria bacterium]